MSGCRGLKWRQRCSNELTVRCRNPANAAQALQLTEMADKVSRVVAATLALGNVVPMTEESAERIDTREDEQIRRVALARATLQQPATSKDVGDPLA